MSCALFHALLMKTLLLVVFIAIVQQYNLFEQKADKLSQQNCIMCNVFDKKWKLENYEVDGYNLPPDTVNKGYVIFFKDHTLNSVDRGLTIKSKWTYNDAERTIILSSDTTDQKGIMKIITLTENSFVFQTMTGDSSNIIVHMKLLKE